MCPSKLVKVRSLHGYGVDHLDFRRAVALPAESDDSPKQVMLRLADDARDRKLQDVVELVWLSDDLVKQPATPDDVLVFDNDRFGRDDCSGAIPGREFVSVLVELGVTPQSHVEEVPQVIGTKISVE